MCMSKDFRKATINKIAHECYAPWVLCFYLQAGQFERENKLYFSTELQTEARHSQGGLRMPKQRFDLLQLPTRCILKLPEEAPEQAATVVLADV